MLVNSRAAGDGLSRHHFIVSEESSVRMKQQRHSHDDNTFEE